MRLINKILVNLVGFAESIFKLHGSNVSNVELKVLSPLVPPLFLAYYWQLTSTEAQHLWSDLKEKIGLNFPSAKTSSRLLLE